MESIRNHYMLWEAALGNRLMHADRFEWTREAPTSTTAGYAAKADSEDKADRMTCPLGAGKAGELSLADLVRVQALWTEQDDTLAALLTKFHEAMRKRDPKNRAANFVHWNRQRHNPRERKYFAMSRKITLYDGARYAGNTFRTQVRAFAFEIERMVFAFY